MKTTIQRLNDEGKAVFTLKFDGDVKETLDQLFPNHRIVLPGEWPDSNLIQTRIGLQWLEERGY